MPLSKYQALHQLVNRIASAAAMTVAMALPIGCTISRLYTQAGFDPYDFLMVVTTSLLLSGIVFLTLRRVLSKALEKTVRTLMESEERFRALVQAASSAIIVLDHRGCVLEFNRAAEQFYSFRFEQGDPISPSFLALMRFDDDWDDISSAGTQNTESTFHTLEGEERTLLWTASRFMEGDPDTDAAGLVLLGQDITERKKLERALQDSEALLRLALDGASMGIWHWQPDTETFDASEQAKVLFGLDPHIPVTLRLVLDALHDEDEEVLSAALQQAVDYGNALDKAVRMQHPDGHPHWIAWRGRWIIGSEEQPGRLIGVVHDATQHKELEEVLIQAKLHAERANKAKSEFLSMMSHELRSPMTGILGAIGLLLETSLEKDQREYAQIAHDSAWALLTLLNDILDVAKLEAGKITIELLPFELQQMLSDVMHLMNTSAVNKHLALTVQVNPRTPRFLIGDAVRIRQILLNLIGNAIKFTEAGNIMVAVAYEPDDVPLETPDALRTQTRGLLKMSVTDTGIGIPPDVQPHLFARFTQADGSISRKYGGTGLGLSICKQLCELMGGEIGLQSLQGVGTMFWFTVRCAVGSDTDTQQIIGTEAAPSSQPVQRRHILIAEDSPINQVIIKSILSKAGHTFEIAHNGRMAVEAVTRTHFDLVLMDVQMPEMDGLRATEMIRALPLPQAHVPIIALTANAMREQRAEYLAAGMDDYVSKPFTEGSLMGAIHRVSATERAVRLHAPIPQEAAPIVNHTLTADVVDAVEAPEALALSPCRSVMPTTEELSPELHAAWQALPIFDNAKLDEICELAGKASCQQLLEALCESMVENMDRLHEALRDGDYPKAKGVAHRLKGEAGAFGAERVAVIATFINDTSPESHPALIVAAFADLEVCCKEAMTLINSHQLRCCVL